MEGTTPLHKTGVALFHKYGACWCTVVAACVARRRLGLHWPGLRSDCRLPRPRPQTRSPGHPGSGGRLPGALPFRCEARRAPSPPFLHLYHLSGAPVPMAVLAWQSVLALPQLAWPAWFRFRRGASVAVGLRGRVRPLACVAQSVSSFFVFGPDLQSAWCGARHFGSSGVPRFAFLLFVELDLPPSWTWPSSWVVFLLSARRLRVLGRRSPNALGLGL